VDEYKLAAAKAKCSASHLFFTRYYFKQREGAKFLVNWHHEWLADELEKVLTGETENLAINVPPGSSKTEMVVVNFIARGIAKNPRARFLHLSYSDDLALLNSAKARDIVTSDEYQALYPLKLSADTKAKKRWNVTIDGEIAGGVYATSLAGQVTGFRAGHMAPGFQGAILIDDPMKPEDAYSKTKRDAANRKLLTTVKSRRAKPKTPIILIMQRVSEGDPTQFVLEGGLQVKFKHVKIPALIDDKYVKENIPEKYWSKIDSSVRDSKGRFSYWEFKEPLAELLAMESGEGTNQQGQVISKHVFNSQYQQSPRALGGNLIKGSMFHRYTVLPKLRYRMIYGDTAQKTKEHNDYSVFQCWGYGEDGRIYLLDQIRGKWEAPELLKRARAFWSKHKQMDNYDQFGTLRMFKPEDKSSGTGLIQQLRSGEPALGIKPIPVPRDEDNITRSTDKLTRVMDGLPYLDLGQVAIPLDAPWVSDFIDECEAFTPDDTHAHDDQIDPLMDAIKDILSPNSVLKRWEALADD
jgi:predicted phage terminase large subunit-like protein